MICDTSPGPVWLGGVPDSVGVQISAQISAGSIPQGTCRPWLAGPAGLRRLVACERDLLAPHLLRLHTRDRRQRFCGQVSAGSILRHASSRDSSRASRIGFFDDGCLRGCGELYLFPGNGTTSEAEFALSVESRWQNQGIGARMLGWLIVLARNRCVSTLRMHCLADNLPMRALARTFAIRQSLRQGVIDGTLRLAPPDTWSVTCELGLNSVTWAHRLWWARAP